MGKTVEEHLEMLGHVEVLSVWSRAGESLVDGNKKVIKVPAMMGMTLAWGGTMGFGELTFSFHADGKTIIDSEYMSKEFVEAVLIKLARNSILADDLEKAEGMRTDKPADSEG